MSIINDALKKAQQSLKNPAKKQRRGVKGWISKKIR